jgi:hypothetical protein
MSDMTKLSVVSSDDPAGLGRLLGDWERVADKVLASSTIVNGRPDVMPSDLDV